MTSSLVGVHQAETRARLAGAGVRAFFHTADEWGLSAQLRLALLGYLVGRSMVFGVAFASLMCCTVQRVTAQATSSRDSAGIRIVENPALTDAPVRFRLAPQASFDIGGLAADPDLEFDTKRGTLRAVPLSSGGLAVLDITRVQIFSRSGARERVIGRAGGGPREFRELYSGCGLRGATLVVFDGQLARVVTLSPQGEFVQSTQRDEVGATLLHPCFDDGTILVKRTLARRAGSVAYFGDGRTGEIRVFGREGGLLRMIRTRDRLVPITAQDVETELDRTFPPGVMAAGSDRSATLARARANVRRKSWPVYAQILPGDDGRLWVQHYRRLSSLMNSPFASESWTAFDSLGRMEGRLVLPAPVLRGVRPPRVISFMRGGVLLLRLDEDGAAHFSLYPLQTVGAARVR